MHEPLEIPCVFTGGNADAQRRRDGEIRPLHDGGGESEADLLGNRHRIFLGDVFQHRQELVSTLPREQIVGAHNAPRNAGEKPQDLVAGGVAVPVVQLLEMVDIEISRDIGEREHGHVLGKAATIERAGQRIVVGEVLAAEPTASILRFDRSLR